MIVDDPKHAMSKRETYHISRILLFPRLRKVTRLGPRIKGKIKKIISKRLIYGYRRRWAVLRNQGTRVNSKTVESDIFGEKSLPAIRKAQGQNKNWGLFRPMAQDRLLKRTSHTYRMSRE